MNLDSIAPLAARLVWTESTGSTNTDLVKAVTIAPDKWPEFSVVGSDFQTQGRGRSGRDWTAPAGSSLFVSVLLKPPSFRISSFGWIPLIGGLAARTVLADLGLGGRVKVKWPNDVLIEDLKVAGLLSEYVPAAESVVLGMGLNLGQSREELPIETATSLKLEGLEDISAELILRDYLKNLKAEYQAFISSECDADRSGLRLKLKQASGTLNRQVRAILPGDSEIVGLASDIDSTGRLTIEHDGTRSSLSAADIVHLRHDATS